MSFVKEFINHTSAYESPTSFWKWSAYCTIAAILRDSCYRRQGDVFTYPNIYVLLLADSAVHRKGNPVTLCEELVKKIQNTKVISGRSSIQAILDELARGETDAKTGRMLKGGSALFSASELSAGIVNDPEAIKILTDIYDFKAEYTSRLRGTGTFRIKNICFTMMAASNEELLRDVYNTGAIFGGLLGRTFLVKPSEFRPANSLFRYKPLQLSYDSMLKHLTEIAMLSGQFEIEEEAIQEYESWYGPFRESYKNKKDKSGVAGRIHIGILKLAMILAVNDRKELVIRKQHIEESINDCLSLIPNYNQFVMAGGKSSTAEVGSIVLNDIYEAKDHTLSRKEILRRHWNDFDAETFDKLITTLQQAGMIDYCMGGTEMNYRMTQKCLDTLFKEHTKNGK